MLAWLWLLPLLGAGLPGFAVVHAATASAPAELRWMGRDIYTMRMPVAGATPQQRAERALERLRAVPPEARLEPVRMQEVMRDRERALALVLGDDTLLTVLSRDLDPETGVTLEEVASHSRDQLQAALRARAEMERPEVLLRGSALTLTGALVLVAAGWGANRLRSGMKRRMQRMVERGAATHRVLGVDWTEFGLRAVAAASMAVAALGGLMLLYTWVAHSLRQFPATQPLAEELRQWLLGLMGRAAGALWDIAPNLAMIALVIVTARSVVWMLNQVFAGVMSGRFRVPGLHPETARATRRLAVFAVWGLALAAAYPYIPGSQSDVFRGLSVFLGFMFTLGSTGVVSQWMHGLVIVYSRALRVGDFVRIGAVEGVVKELGALSVKVVDHRQDEVTVPNSSVVAGPVTNLSRLVPGGGVHGAVTVTIGYDVPWRRVHELLLEAAARTPQVTSAVAPLVLQRALADHAVAYELVVSLQHPGQHAQAMSALHGHVRDTFEAAGVAILSPLMIHQVGAGPAGAQAPSGHQR